MTDTDTTTTDAATGDVTVDDPAEVRPGDTFHPAVPLDRLAPHPDNVRRDLGDLGDLTRSVKNKGVLIPILALPMGDDGVHLIVAGHRRYTAAVNADIATVPVVVRDLTPVEVLDTMLTENDQRSDISLIEQIRAVARYQVLAPDETPTKIGKRIGRTVRWVKDRFAVAALPDQVLASLDSGDLTLAQAVAVAGVVDRGDDDVIACAAWVVARRGWHDRPADTVADWCTRTDNARTVEAMHAKLTEAGVTVYTSSDEVPGRAADLDDRYGGLAFTKDEVRQHRHEACHAVALWLDYSGRVAKRDLCTDPKRHRGTAAKPATSEIVSDTTAPSTGTSSGNSALDKARREAREERLTAAAGALSGRVRKVDTQRLAALVLIGAADRDQIKAAARLVGHEATADEDYHAPDHTLIDLLDAKGDPTPVLAALAVGWIESRGTKSSELPAWGDDAIARRDAYLGWLAAHTDHDGTEPAD